MRCGDVKRISVRANNSSRRHFVARLNSGVERLLLKEANFRFGSNDEIPKDIQHPIRPFRHEGMAASRQDLQPRPRDGRRQRSGSFGRRHPIGTARHHQNRNGKD